MTTLRVLHVIPSLSAADGGPPRAVMLMAQALQRRGVEVSILATNHDAANAVDGGSGSDDVPRVLTRLWVTPYKVAPGLVTWLLRHGRQYDVMHIHALFSFASTAAAWAACRTGVPYVVRPLGTLGAYGMTQRHRRLKQLSVACIEGPILRRAAAVHFTSEAEAAEAGRLGVQCREAIIPIGFGAAEAGGANVEPGGSFLLRTDSSRARRVRQTDGGRERCTLLLLSRLDRKKNVEALIDAVAQSETLRRTCRVVIAGDGEASYVGALRRRAEAGGVGGIVQWLGPVSGARKAQALADADVFVLPSYAENFGIAAAEAMLAGLPCVLAPGVAIADGAAAAGGAIVAGPDAACLALALRRVVKDEPLRRDMGRRARDHAQSAYATEAMGERLEALYRHICRYEDQA